MRVEGAIVPAGKDSRVNCKAWCRLIDSRPELHRPKTRQAINPFTREPMVIRPRSDVADVIVDGFVVGKASWSMSEDDPQVHVSVERPALPLVLEWAAALVGEFREDVSSAETEA